MRRPDDGRQPADEPHVWVQKNGHEALAYKPAMLSESDMGGPANGLGAWRCPVCLLTYPEWGCCAGSLLEGWHRPALTKLREAERAGAAGGA